MGGPHGCSRPPSHRGEPSRQAPAEKGPGLLSGWASNTAPFRGRPEWFPDWSGHNTVIVGGGPSATGAELGQAAGRARVLAVNDAYRLCPDADALYACDGQWWKQKDGCAAFKGLRITQDRECAGRFGLNLIRVQPGVSRLVIDVPGEVGWGGNSGFHALNLALQFGARRIILVGFDMRTDQGIHWFGAHGQGLHNPTREAVARWRKTLDGCAPQLAAIGATVLNASPVSALEAFPKVSLKEALA